MNHKISIYLLVLFGLLAATTVIAGTDRFGIKQIYPTMSDGKQWVSNWDNGVARSFTGIDPQDAWFDAAHGNASFVVDGKGLFKISGSVPRMYIHDPAKLKSWRNVEMTVYAMRVADSGTAYAGITGVARANHGITGSVTTDHCDSRALGARMRYDGHIDFEKEISHPSNVAVQNKTIWSSGMPKNIWIGYKYVVYDLADGNVKQELWMDQSDGLNGGNWVKVNEFTDTGKNFGVGATPCKAGIDPALRYTNSDARPGSESGKPNISVYFRSDNVGTNGLVYKMMSVREISPAASTTADTTVPLLSGITAENLLLDSATLSWTTNEPADSQVEYGTTTAYGQSSTLNASLATSHRVELTGLNGGTTYHYRVISRDASGNKAVSSDRTFKTAADCIASSGTWANTQLPSTSSTMTVEFNATPSGSSIDGVMGVSNGPVFDYTQLAAIVRFNTAGKIDARNGSVYEASTAIPYTIGKTYRFRFYVNVTNHIYNASVSSDGGATYQFIGKGYAFRSEQSSATALNNLATITGVGSETVCSVVTATP